MPFNPLLEKIKSIALEAGNIALSYKKGEFEIITKADSSPVTEADLAVNAFLEKNLKALLPQAGWLSEETLDNEERLTKEYLFVIDPIDGTRAFIKNLPEWCISIGLLRNNEPFLGVVYQPVLKKLYYAEMHKGAFCNDEKLEITKKATTISGALPMVQGYGFSEPRNPPIPSLALRFISVATNENKIALASQNAHDWDIAAAALIVSEAGGIIKSLNNAPFALNKPSLKQPALICTF